jgi:fucose permease
MYAAELKYNLKLTQSQLDTLSSATFCAGIFSWVPGLIVDKLGTRVGTVSGGMLGTVSLCCYWAVATKFFPVERFLIVPLLSLLGVLIFLSCALIVSLNPRESFGFPPFCCSNMFT